MTMLPSTSWRKTSGLTATPQTITVHTLSMVMPPALAFDTFTTWAAHELKQ
jgi:hypothetical protein